MEQTVIGLFRRIDEVQHAAEQLRQNGFSDEAIDADVQFTDTPGILDTNELYVRDGDNEYAGDSIGRFFRSLFDNKEEAEKFTLVARRHSVLAVKANSEAAAARAAQILDSCGAITVDEYVNDLNDRHDAASGVRTEVGARGADGLPSQAGTSERQVGDKLSFDEQRLGGQQNPAHGPVPEDSRFGFPEGEHREA